jgi:hypothetical protein
MSTSLLGRLGLASSDDGEARETSSRKAVLGMTALAVAAIGAAGVVLLTGGSEDVGDLGISPAAAAAARSAESATPQGPQSPTPTPSPSFADASEIRDGRDPFVALYEAPVAAGTGADAAPAPAGQEAPTDGEAGRTDEEPGAPAPAPAVDAPGGGTGTPDELASASTVSLVRVEGGPTARSAVLTVDGSQQRAAVGESFGPSGSLLLLSLQEGPDEGQWTAVLQVGQGDPFDVVTGAAVRLPTS